MSPFQHYWTRKKIRESLLALQEQVGHVPTVKEVRAFSKDDPKNFPSYSTVIREYESDEGEKSPWQKALIDAGMDATYARRGRRPKGMFE